MMTELDGIRLLVPELLSAIKKVIPKVSLPLRVSLIILAVVV